MAAPGLIQTTGSGANDALLATGRDYTTGSPTYDHILTNAVIAAYQQSVYFNLRPGLVFNSVFTVRAGENTTQPGWPVIFSFYDDIDIVREPLKQTEDPALSTFKMRTFSIVPREYGAAIAPTLRLRKDTFIPEFDMNMVELLSYNMISSLEELAITHMIGQSGQIGTSGDVVRQREPNPFFLRFEDVASQLPSDNTNQNSDQSNEEFQPGRGIARSAIVGGKIVGQATFGLWDASVNHQKLWEGIGFVTGSVPGSFGYAGDDDAPVATPSLTTGRPSSVPAQTTAGRGLGAAPETGVVKIAENDTFGTSGKKGGMQLSDKLTANLMREMQNLLARESVRPIYQGEGLGTEGMGGWYVAILHPDTCLDLYNEAGDEVTWLAMANRQDKKSIHTGAMGPFAGFQMISSNRCHVFPYINPKIGSSADTGGLDDDGTISATAADNTNKETDFVHGYSSYFFGDESWARAVGIMPQIRTGPVTDLFQRFVPLTWYTYMGWDRFRAQASHMLIHATSGNRLHPNSQIQFAK